MAHVEAFHLLVDVWALWSISDVERKYGSLHFASRTLLLAVVLCLGRFALFHVASRYRLGHVLQPLGATVATVGATGLLLGWVMLELDDVSVASMRYCAHGSDSSGS